MPYNTVMESSIFEDFRSQSLAQLQNLKPEDINIFDHKDSPANYALVGKPNVEAIEIFREIYKELRLIDLDQYYYPLEILHLTFVGDLPLDLDVNKLIEAAEIESKNFNLNF